MTVIARDVPPGLSERSRTVLGLPPAAWYTDHAYHSSPVPRCACTSDAPDPRCDVGESLWRLRDRPARGLTA